MTIVEMLARNARNYPDESALIELKPSQKMRRESSWRVFDERVNRVANALAARGVGKGDKVLHLMLNSINWLEAYFGIIRTGAWAVPLNFRFTTFGANVKGTVTVEPSQVNVHADLPLMAAMFKGTIEAKIRDRLARLLA